MAEDRRLARFGDVFIAATLALVLLNNIQCPQI